MARREELPSSFIARPSLGYYEGLRSRHTYADAARVKHRLVLADTPNLCTTCLDVLLFRLDTSLSMAYTRSKLIRKRIS
jgi:hypothetical protein